MPTKDQGRDQARTAPTTSPTTTPAVDEPTPTPAPEGEGEDEEDEEVQPEPSSIAFATAEAAAWSDALADSVEDTKHGPVLILPKTREEHIEVANAQQAKVNEALGLGRPVAAVDPDAPRPRKRVFSMDAPYNLAERGGFDPLRPDMTTDAVATVAAPAGSERR